MEKNIMTPRERIEELQADFIEKLQDRRITQGMQQAMNQMDFSRETDKEKVKTIEEALCAITILDAVNQDEELEKAFTEYSTTLGAQTIVEQLDIHKQDLSGLPPELKAMLDFFSKRI